MNFLQSLKPTTSKSKKRVGRGYGSGLGGHTAGRGQKGQKARNSVALWFEGGQLPLIKRLPMLRGKGRLKSLLQIETITLNQLEKIGIPVVTLQSLKAARVIKQYTKQVKVLATGTLTKKIQVEGLLVSKKAKEHIEKVGGFVLHK